MANIRDAATLLLPVHSSRSGYALYLAATNILPRRLCFLGIVNIGTPATLPLRSWRPAGQLQAWFKCPVPGSSVGVALLDSRTTLLFGLMLSAQVKQFQSCRGGFLGIPSTSSNEEEMSCSRTQYRAPGEIQTHNLAFKSQ